MRGCQESMALCTQVASSLNLDARAQREAMWERVAATVRVPTPVPAGVGSSWSCHNQCGQQKRQWRAGMEALRWQLALGFASTRDITTFHALLELCTSLQGLGPCPSLNDLAHTPKHLLVCTNVAVAHPCLYPFALRMGSWSWITMVKFPSRFGRFPGSCCPLDTGTVELQQSCDGRDESPLETYPPSFGGGGHLTHPEQVVRVVVGIGAFALVRTLAMTLQKKKIFFVYSFLAVTLVTRMTLTKK